MREAFYKDLDILFCFLFLKIKYFGFIRKVLLVCFYFHIFFKKHEQVLREKNINKNKYISKENS